MQYILAIIIILLCIKTFTTRDADKKLKYVTIEFLLLILLLFLV